MIKRKEAIVLGIMCTILTIGLCLQIRTVNISGTTTSSNSELNQLKAQVLKMQEKYDELCGKIDVSQKELENTRKKLTNKNEDLKALEEKIKKYYILVGETDVKGKGIVITVTDAVTTNNPLIEPEDMLIHDRDLWEIVNELNSYGAEAIEINGQRIVADTAISCDGNVIAINNEKVSSTFTINAIGFPERLAAINSTDGYLKCLEGYDIKTTCNQLDEVYISKFIRGINFKYAKKVK